ncbi:MAG: helix-turn-helix domain-containing protein [Parasporobacterium sp.]|nr:helix-turn-helix domain-containing protein [Parasporobacterium sp.]
METLECFLNNGGSIKAVSEQMFIHQNTILYRMANIKKLLNCPLESSQDRLRFTIACMIRKMEKEVVNSCHFRWFLQIIRI